MTAGAPVGALAEKLTRGEPCQPNALTAQMRMVCVSHTDRQPSQPVRAPAAAAGSYQPEPGPGTPESAGSAGELSD